MIFFIKKFPSKITAVSFLITFVAITFVSSETAQSIQAPWGPSIIVRDKVAPLPDILPLPAPKLEKKVEAVEPVRLRKGTIPAGWNFSLILKKEGLSYQEIYKLVKAINEVQQISRVQAGTPYSVSFRGDKFIGLRYETGTDEVVSAVKSGDGYIVAKLPIEYEVRIESKEGVIKDHLYNTVMRMGERPALVYDVADVFAWDINFFKDLQKGDRLKLLVEKKYRNGKFVKYGKLLGAEITNRGKKITAIYFPEKGDYFTPDGKPMKKKFLKAPLKFARISSRFTHKRFHPILKKNMPHLSVDYAAPRGTPIYSVADGVVELAARRGPSGNLVRIRHNNIYTTAYCHLSAFGKGIKPGAVVKQGQVIGNVGMTGRATGPHLCFHLKRNGVPINPLKFESPKAEPIQKETWNAFVTVRQDVMGRLSSKG